jgi:hypothetical protein
MSDNPLVAVAVVDREPAGESLPVPTPEQEKAADQLFARPVVEHHAAAELLGMVASVQFLQDLAGEVFRRNSREDIEPEERPEPIDPEHPE